MRSRGIPACIPFPLSPLPPSISKNSPLNLGAVDRSDNHGPSTTLDKLPTPIYGSMEETVFSILRAIRRCSGRSNRAHLDGLYEVQTGTGPPSLLWPPLNQPPIHADSIPFGPSPPASDLASFTFRAQLTFARSANLDVTPESQDAPRANAAMPNVSTSTHRENAPSLEPTSSPCAKKHACWKMSWPSSRRISNMPQMRN